MKNKENVKHNEENPCGFGKQKQAEFAKTTDEVTCLHCLRRERKLRW